MGGEILVNEKAKKLFEKGEEFLNQNKFEDAIISFDAALKIDDEYVDALNSKGVALSYLGKHQEAIDCFDKIISIDSDYDLALFNKGLDLYFLGKYKEAQTFFSNFLKKHTLQDDLYLDALYYQALALIEFGEFDAILKLLEEIVEINPEYMRAQELIPLVLMDMDKFQEALERTNKILELMPDNVRLWNTRGEILRDLENNEEALKSYEKALKLDENAFEAWLGKGLILKEFGKKNESLECFKIFIKIVRDNKISDFYFKANRVADYLNWMEKTGGKVTINPREKPQYWQWVTKPEYFLEDDDSERESLNPKHNQEIIDIEPGAWWTCHKDTKAGDLVLLYRSGEKDGIVYRDIKYLIMATTDAYPINDISDMDNWHYGCDYLPLFKFQNSLSFDEIKNDSYLDEWNAFRKNFQGIAFKTEESIWKHLTDILIDKNPEYAEFLDKFDWVKIMDKKIDEITIEEQLSNNLDILKDFGYELENPERQKLCLGDGGYIDILTQDKNTGEYVVIELKVIRADRDVFGQISSYMGWVMKKLSNRKPIRGIVISPGSDTKFDSARLTNPQIDHIELNEVLGKLGIS